MTALTPLEFTITSQDMVAYGGATWDWHRLHHDADYARSRGVERPVVDGQVFGAYFAAHLAEHLGVDFLDLRQGRDQFLGAAHRSLDHDSVERRHVAAEIIGPYQSHFNSTLWQPARDIIVFKVQGPAVKDFDGQIPIGQFSNISCKCFKLLGFTAAFREAIVEFPLG